MTQTLRVGAAFGDPPFNGAKNNGGLDISMMRAIGDVLGMTVEFVRFPGADFNGIFDVLNAGDYDCVTAGTTVTPGRERLAAFCEPHLLSGQSLAVDVRRNPAVRTIDDLAGLGKAKAVRVYDYGNIHAAIADLTAGGCDVFMKLAPVLTELVRPVDGVEVVQRGISTERIATAVRHSGRNLLQCINAAQDELEKNGRMPEIRRAWLGSPRLDQSGTAPTGDGR